jgi:hypothetical protein
MRIRISSFFKIQFFLLLLSSMALGQEYIFPDIRPMSPGFKIDVITGEDFVLSYVMDANQGILTLTIKDGEFQTRHFEEYRIGLGFNRIQHEVDGDLVYLLLSNGSSSKILTKINTQNSDVQVFPFSSIQRSIEKFKVIGNSILFVQSLMTGDLVQLYDYRTEARISLSEFYAPKTRIWDVQVKDGIFDILTYRKGDSRYQSLKMLGFNVFGYKLYEIEISPPGIRKFVFKSAKLIPSAETGYRLAGIYAKKQGEQFCGYYHVSINDSLEQNVRIHPMSTLEGFFDFKKNPGLRKNAKNSEGTCNYTTYASRELCRIG